MIKDIFHNEIINECASNKLKIGDDTPAILFDTIINEEKINTSNKNNIKPILVINDKNSFFIALENYVNKAILFYFDGNFTHDNVKAVICYVLSNATDFDLSNPVSYLNLRSSFLSSDIPCSTIYKNIFGYDSIIKIKSEKSILEAPFSFSCKLKYYEDEYEFPNIFFGISNDICYIYAIQNKFREKNDFQKKINRLLYKINNGYEFYCDNDLLNPNDVTMSFLAIITIFINYLNELGINKINVPINLPIRYNAHYESYKRRLEYNKEVLDNDSFIKYKDDLDLKNKYYDDNTILKLIRNFYRLQSQGDVLKINKYPFMDGSILSININKNGMFNNEILNELLNNSKIIK
mgnify:CR=1 FL=1